MPAKPSDIAVVVPARDAARTLPATLEALRTQDFDGTFEVVVVDDGSTDATQEVARAAGARVVRTGGPSGPAAARNAGVKATDAPLLAFTDSDCIPCTGWLREGSGALRSGADLVTGPIQPCRPAGLFDRTLAVDGPSPLFESANLFVTRAAFGAAGGFERPAFLPPSVPHFGEDVLFGWRTMRTGARRAHARGALVLHEVFPRPWHAFVAERWRLRFFPPLVREAPEIRESMPLQVFLSATTARASVAAAAIIATAATRRLPLLAATIPYARRRLILSAPWRPGVLRSNAILAVADAVGTAALLWGSARSRTLVL